MNTTTRYGRLPVAAVAALLCVAVSGCGSAASSPALTSPPSTSASSTPASSAVGTAETSSSTAPATGMLPGAQAYVDAVNRGDLDALVNAFAPQGEVVDVTRRIRGRDAIRTWARNEVIGGSLRVEGVTPAGPGAQRLRVHWSPAGSSGWAADYTFTGDGNQVAVADLQYAS